jgi:hypothetical protein
VVVERARAQLPRELEQFLHRLVHEPLELAKLLGHRRRIGVVHEGLEAEKDGGERLVHLVV